MQHDIFLYLYEKKGIKEFNAGSRRYAYILAKYYPNFLGRNRYSHRNEQLVADFDGIPEPSEFQPEITGEIGGTPLGPYLLPHSSRRRIPTSSDKRVDAFFSDGTSRRYAGVVDLIADLGISEFTAYNWLKNGKTQAKSKPKYAYILGIEYVDEQIPNPIAGSKLKPRKRFSLKQFEAVRDQYENSGEGNETVELYVHKETGDVALVKLTKD